MTANSTGKAFELKCIELIKQHRSFVNTSARIHWSNTNFYRPDAITETELFEFKYQQVAGSVRNKLTQAVLELQWMSENTNQQAVLVYEGKEIESFINKDPAFKMSLNIAPSVKLLHIHSLYDYLTASVDSNNRDSDRLLEYSTACA
jgi:hypothetical protein